ncbi:uncharacterized protein LOC142587833 [Dermacentor variabilis]|uniref:uncharacterized protein LOC142587833 n=1 Tax=Dermacentor variabilis TaxID=34621 RepID=UPI003F5C174D
MGEIRNVVLVCLLSVLSALGSGGGAKIAAPGNRVVIVSPRNATYIIPVRSNGQFKPLLTSAMKNRNDGAPSTSEVREGPHVYDSATPLRQIILVPKLTYPRMQQAIPAGPYGYGSLVDNKPPGLRDFLFCFESGGSEMCVRVDLTSGRLMAAARSNQEVRKRRRKAWPRKKVNRKRKAPRSWKDTVRDTFWPEKQEYGKSGRNDIPAFLEDTMDVFTFKNLTVWRNVRWKRVMNTTDLGTHPIASAKLNATLLEPAEKEVTAQATKDILLLHELLELTQWSSDKKWAEFEKGYPLLATLRTVQKGWGPDLDPPSSLSRAGYESSPMSEVESKPIFLGHRWMPPGRHEDPEPEFATREKSVYGTESKSKSSNKMLGAMAWNNRQPAEDEYVFAIPQSGSDIYAPAKHSNRDAGSSVRVGHQNFAGASSTRRNPRRRKYGLGGGEQHNEWIKTNGDYVHSYKNMDDSAYRRRRYHGASSLHSVANRPKWHRPHRGGGMAAKQPNVRNNWWPTRGAPPTIRQTETEPSEVNELIQNRKAFGKASNRLVLFAETVRLGTMRSEFGWKLLTKGFKLFSNKSHITEEEMKDFVAKLPPPMLGSTFQDTMNAMIIYDLIAFNGSGDYNKWAEMERQRLPIGAARTMSRIVQSRLATAKSLKPMEDWYVRRLGELINMKLSILILNASYDKDIAGLLSKKLSVDVTPESLETQKNFLTKNRLSAKLLEDVYSNELWDAMLLNLISLNDPKGTSPECAKYLPRLSLRDANNTEYLVKEVDEIISKLKGTNSTIREKCMKELLFLKLLTLAKNTEQETVWRDVIVIKWTNLSGTEAAEGATFSPQTISVLRGFVHASDLSIFYSLVQQIRNFVHKRDMVKSADSVVRTKFLNAVRNAPSQMRETKSSESSKTVLPRSKTEDTGKNGSFKGQPSVPGTQPELSAHDDSRDARSQEKAFVLLGTQQGGTTTRKLISETMITKNILTTVTPSGGK